MNLAAAVPAPCRAMVRRPWLGMLALLAIAAILVSLASLRAASAGTTVQALALQEIPLRIYRPVEAARGPVVVIAHGFAGSQQLMESFALTLARNGYIAVTFDFPGHGRNPAPLTGSLTELDGATRSLLAALTRVAEFARPLGDGRLALLGHSMACDIVVRYAQAHPEVLATIAVSMYSPAVTAGTPRNLLVIVGDWEGMLKREALRVVGLSIAPTVPAEGVTYGDFAGGSARRTAFSPHVEHASVLFSQHSMDESVRWLDQSFAINRPGGPRLDARGPWILLLLAGSVALARALSAWLPRVSRGAPLGGGRPWSQLAWPLLLPMVATPLLLRVLPTRFLPLLVGDYLALHFALYGLLTAACMRWPRGPRPAGAAWSMPAFVLATAAVTGYEFLALAWPLDAFVISFAPGPQRLLLIAIMLAGPVVYFASSDWLTYDPRAPLGSHLAARGAFLVSLAMAVALDLNRLFFLVIIIVVIPLVFLVYDLISWWTYRRTGHPLVGAIASGVALAWAIGVTFPLVAG